jgi:CRISPR-associated protein Csx10
MYSQRFRCTTQEPLILFKKAKTEQSTEGLEYISGSLFRGYVAGNLFKDKELSRKEENGLSREKEEALNQTINDLIFNGSVCFGDAHLVIDEERSLPLPLSYHKYQTNVKPAYINLVPCDVPDEKHKQVREGYFVQKNGELLSQSPKHSERMKAARSLANRASEEGAMYLYRFIEAGQCFEFTVKAKTEPQLTTICEYLTKGNIYLGKSKSAEFGGKVKVEALGSFEKISEEGGVLKVKSLFAASNWCFLNEFGSYTALLTSEMLCGDKNAEIDWEKTFLRFRTYSPFNSHRNAYDAQRLIIEKGSVVTFKEPVSVSREFYTAGIGVHHTEGFGEVKWNCAFLEDLHEFDIKPFEGIDPENQKTESNDPLYLLLKMRKVARDQLNADYDKVEESINKDPFSSIGSSQWGNVQQKIKKAKDIERVKAILFTDENTKLDKSRHSKWGEKEINKLKNRVNECGNVQAFNIYVKSMINLNRDKKNE